MGPPILRSGPPQKLSATLGLLIVAIGLLVIVITRLSLVPTGYAILPPTDGATTTITNSNAAAAAASASWQLQARTTGAGWMSSGITASRNNNNNGGVRRIFVVGCGHSGTSLLFRSIGNMRGVRCLKKETALFIKNTEGDERLHNVLADWDGMAQKGNFLAWVEKTPRHVYHIQKMLDLDPLPNNTRIIFIHRDGRDVAASFRARGYSWEKAINRWVEDNTIALPFIDTGAALPVSFEGLTSAKGVLKELRKVAAFLELPVLDTTELALALLPGTKPRQYQEYCTPYANDEEKFDDLTASLVDVLAGKDAPLTKKPDPEDLDEDLSEKMVEHNAFRTWQMAQAWAEVVPPTSRNWTWEEERYFFGRNDVRQLMKRFGYPDGMSG